MKSDKCEANMVYNPLTKRTYISPSLRVGEVPIPCNKCLYCRTRRARELVTRCLLETLRFEGYFLTITYDDCKFKSPTLIQEHITKFAKSLRDWAMRYNDSPIRFFTLGHYGDLKGRPHYHMLISNLSIPKDSLTFYKKENDSLLFKYSPIEDIWNKGFVLLSDLSVGRAHYVCNYVSMEGIERSLYEERGLVPPFNLHSRQPLYGSICHYDTFEEVKTNYGLFYADSKKYSVPVCVLDVWLRQGSISENFYNIVLQRRLEYVKLKEAQSQSIPDKDIELEALARALRNIKNRGL